MDSDLILAVAILAIGLIAIPIIAWRLLFPRYRTFERIYEETAEIVPSSDAEPVHVVFHTYDGFLIYMRQVKHEATLPPEQARLWLKRLHRENLTHGLLAAGGVIVPFVSYLNYRMQLRKLRVRGRDEKFRLERGQISFGNSWPGRLSSTC
jgi:hypothetical protein